MSKITRRDFLYVIKRVLAATGLTALISPVIAYFYPPDLAETPSERVQVSTLDELPPGASVKVQFGRYPAIVIHTQEGLRAYSAVCTHFSCIVDWDEDQNRIVCPCHDGFFEPINGEVISGPPPTPLNKIDVTVEDGEIYIGGSA